MGTLGRLTYIRDCQKSYIKERPHWNNKMPLTIVPLILACRPHVRSPPPWGRRRHGISKITSPGYALMSSSINVTWELEKWDFIGSLVDLQVVTRDIDFGHSSQSARWTSLDPNWTSIQETGTELANFANNSGGKLSYVTTRGHSWVTGCRE